MNTYEHSVYLDIDKCNGCTTCLKHCPTEAIRIRDNHAVINQERCIDCGECIRVCPHSAKKAVCDKLSDMDKFKYKIALPAPTLYGQFDNLDDVDYVLNGLLKLGFDDVFEVSAAAELVSVYTRNYLKKEGIKKPLISSACPVIMRLICLRFPSLKENIIPMLPPMEVAARLARERALKNHPELSPEDIGVCFKLISKMKYGEEIKSLSSSGIIGIGWASSGGESTAIFNDSYLAADGIDNCNKVLDQIENGNIPPLEFIELNACTGGCVGGVLTIQNPFIAKARLQGLRHYLPVSLNFVSKEEEQLPDSVMFSDMPEYKPISRLSDSMAESMRMLAEIQKLKAELPGIDCGSCGAPNCRAFAEDVVKKDCDLENCLIRQRYKKVSDSNDG